MSQLNHNEKLEKLAILEKKAELQEGLPFLYGWKWYEWAKDFFDSTNKVNLLCAANQISKSSTQIRKCIDWATNKKKWNQLWAHKPKQFWYLYPTQDVVKIEFETKWKQFLPSGKYKNDPQYGWKDEWQHGKLFAIHFFSGVHIYFKTYAQNVQHLQTGSVDALFCDEELPVDLYDELMFRISASNGYFHMVFTATIGQDFWRRAMEPGPREEETLKGAWKKEVSMYECMEYIDGTPGPWTEEKIQTVKNRCKSHNEVLKRVYGRFVSDDGLKYPAFDSKRHMKEFHPIPKSWEIYGGVDVGSGGKDGHPAAVTFVAVSPNYRSGRVFLGWRGDDEETTASDILDKYREFKTKYNLSVTRQFYDWSSKDFDTVSTRMGEVFEKAEKSHDIGEDIVNVLFKNDMLYIYDTVELQKLAGELSTLKKNTAKRVAKDDFTDALRYAITKIPWDFSVITGAPAQFGMEEPEEKLSPIQRRTQERRQQYEDFKRQQREEEDLNAEFEEWNDLYG